MNNENKNSRNIGELMAQTYVTKWFSDIQYALKISEVKEGSYDYRFVDSNVGGGGVNTGGKFNFRFQAGKFECLSLENSYIELKQKVKVTIPPQRINNGNAQVPDWKEFYVWKYSLGYRNAAAIFAQYIIYSHTNILYQSSNAYYEWFLDTISVDDNAIRNDDTYANLEKVRACKPGHHEYITVSNVTADTEYEIILHLRIPLMRFITFIKINICWIGWVLLILSYIHLMKVF